MNNKQRVGIDANLGIVGVIEAVAFFPHDAQHRHQSVALDLILDCDPGCYTLVGTRISAKGEIINATRVYWKPYSAFITPQVTGTLIIMSHLVKLIYSHLIQKSYTFRLVKQ